MQLLLPLGLGLHPEGQRPTHMHMQQGLQAMDTPRSRSITSPCACPPRTAMCRQGAQAISKTLQARRQLGRQRCRLTEQQAQAGKGHPRHLVPRSCAANFYQCDAATNAHSPATPHSAAT